MHNTASLFIERRIRDCIDDVSKAGLDWLPQVVGDVAGRAGEHLVNVGFHVAGVPVRKRVAVSIGTPEQRPDWLRVPITWRPTFPGSALFPGFEGYFELTPHSHDETKVTVAGTYEPPFGPLGKSMDQAIMHAAAKATFEELAAAIASALAGGDGRLALSSAWRHGEPAPATGRSTRRRRAP